MSTGSTVERPLPWTELAVTYTHTQTHCQMLSAADVTSYTLQDYPHLHVQQTNDYRFSAQFIRHFLFIYQPAWTDPVCIRDCHMTMEHCMQQQQQHRYKQKDEDRQLLALFTLTLTLHEATEQFRVDVICNHSHGTKPSFMLATESCQLQWNHPHVTTPQMYYSNHWQLSNLQSIYAVVYHALVNIYK